MHGQPNGSYDVNNYIINYEGGSNGNHNHNMDDNHQNEEKEMSKAKKVFIDLKDKVMNSHPIIKGLVVLLLAPNGFLIGLSILVGKLIASG